VLEETRRQSRKEGAKQAIYYRVEDFANGRQRIQIRSDVRPDAAAEDSACLGACGGNEQRDGCTGNDYEKDL
jgi:hypothetical protein